MTNKQLYPLIVMTFILENLFLKINKFCAIKIQVHQNGQNFDLMYLHVKNLLGKLDDIKCLLKYTNSNFNMILLRDTWLKGADLKYLRQLRRINTRSILLAAGRWWRRLHIYTRYLIVVTMRLTRTTVIPTIYGYI